MKLQNYRHRIFRHLGTIVLTAVLACMSAHSSSFANSSNTQPHTEQTKIENRGAFANRGITASRSPRTILAQQPGFLDRTWALLRHWQQRVNRSLTNAVRAFKTQDVFTASAFLILLSFSYGVLHAAGPGHGKFVISSYVLANERTVRRGIGLAFLAAIFQALSAIAIVGMMAIILNRTGLQIRATEAWITTLSWALVAAIGGWLLYSQLQKVLPKQVDSKHPDIPNHDADHIHDEHCGCGHAHMPSAQDLEGTWSWRSALTIALAVGVRPCTGAVLVLIFAWTQGLFAAGVIATFAMAIGTAITVSALAALAVGSRELATRLAGANSAWSNRVQATAGFVGASLLLILGLTFFAASLGPAQPF